MEIGLVITTWNESRKPGRLERALEIASDPRIVEVVIADDASDDFAALVLRLQELCQARPAVADKLRLVSQPENLGVFGNKLAGIREARSAWLQSLDSDNTISKEYLDCLEQLVFSHWAPPTRIICASFARPNFDYRQYEGFEVTLKTFPVLADWRTFGCFMNTGNQCFHRETMCAVMEGASILRHDREQPQYLCRHSLSDKEHRLVFDSADSYYFNKRWLLAGNSLLILPNLAYDHEVNEHSSWQAAPGLKEVIPPIYTQELLDASQGLSRAYVYLDRCRPGGGAYAIRLEDTNTGEQILVDLSTFAVLPQCDKSSS